MENQIETKKGNKLLLGIIFGVVIGGLIFGGGTYYYVSSFNANEKENTNRETTKNKDDDNGNIADDNNDLAVRDVIIAIKKDADIYMLPGGGPFIKTWNESFPIYLPDNAKSGLPLNKSYGLRNFANQLNEEWKNLIMSEKMISTITGTLSELGFTKYDKVVNSIDSSQYINNKTGVICNVGGASDPYEMSCGHISWLNFADIELSNKLSEAYKAKEGNYPNILSANTKSIVDSSYNPYQRINVSFENFVGLFYRVNNDSNWVYFGGTQGGFSCNEFNSDDIKKSFVGEKCWSSSGSLEEVSP